MKKIFILFVFVFNYFCFFGQNDKPGLKLFSTEVEFRPFSSDPVGLTYFKGRFFKSDNFAYRAGLNIYMQLANSKPINNLGKNDKDFKSTFLIGIYPGFEKHIGQYEHFSPYYGFDLGLAMKISGEKYTSNSGVVTETTGAWIGNSEQAYYVLGLNYVMGADYYFTKNLFLGIEIGLGFNYYINSKVKESVTGQEDQTLDNQSSTLTFGLNYSPFIRLGAKF
ncbi:MAG: BT1926 family outer membrane beta-barrel protein [Bacteroidia bacterium]|nr:BT1926 family outer membrane beta-barrel protein [Bacteroidia bacterium]